MNFKSLIVSEKKQIDQALTDYLHETKSELLKTSHLLGDLFQTFIDINLDGKRVRSLLVKLGYLLAGGTDQTAILKPMLALEIFHSAILAHDDIIDQSPLRRGKPTMHQALGNDHHAISQTIVLADYGFFLANKLISESDFSPDKKNLAFQIFNQIVLDTAIGEIIDVEIPFQNLRIEEKDALTIALYKTARYTFTGPLQIGAVLAGANKDTIDILKKFGDDLGIAFQIRDDILGVYGEVSEMGKSNLSDLKEGKATLLASFAFNKSLDKEKLQKLYGKSNLTISGAQQIRQIFKTSGALDFAERTELKYTNSAISVIEKSDISDEYKTLLKELADFLMERKK